MNFAVSLSCTKIITGPHCAVRTVTDFHYTITLATKIHNIIVIMTPAYKATTSREKGVSRKHSNTCGYSKLVALFFCTWFVCKLMSEMF